MKRAADNKRRYAPGWVHSTCLLRGFPKGAAPHLAHDFAEQSVVCYTLCRRCRENAVAAGEGRQENRAVLVWRGAASAGLFSSADRAYMKAPVPRPTLRLVDKVSRSCGHTPGKVAGQRATVKAEMNGVTPGLDRRPPPRWMGGQGGQSLKVLVRALSDFEVFSFSKLNNQNKFFRLKKFYLLSSSMPYFFFCRIT